MLVPKFFSLAPHLTRQQVLRDVAAGMIVGIIAIPLSIALAIASGVSPEKGLITAVVAGFLISFLGGSRVQVGGPTGAFVILVYGIVREHGYEGLALATLMAGGFLILMGVLRLGRVIEYIPYPITAGFTSGIAVVIFSQQLKDFLGLAAGDLPTEFLGRAEALVRHIGTFNPWSLGLGALSILVILFWPRIMEKVPGPLVAIVLGTVLAQAFGLPVETIGSRFPDLSARIPLPSLPAIRLDSIGALVQPAFAIALLAAIESLLSAVVADGMIGSRHRSNMELVAQGAANIGSVLFGGIPATGAIARTAANIRNGGRTPVAGMVHAVTVLLVMLLFMPYARLIPMAILAAILMMVAVKMGDWHAFRRLWKSTRKDFGLLVLTFGLTVVIDLVAAIQVGVVLSALLFMKSMSDTSRIHLLATRAASLAEAVRSEEEEATAAPEGAASDPAAPAATPHAVQVYEIQGPFFFGVADRFTSVLMSAEPHVRAIVLRMKHVPYMDASALEALASTLAHCRRRHLDLVLCEVARQPLHLMTRSGFLDRLGDGHVRDSVEAAVEAASDAIRRQAGGSPVPTGDTRS